MHRETKKLEDNGSSSIATFESENGRTNNVYVYETFEEVQVRSLERPKVKGKFLYSGKKKLWIRGVTYGTFRPDESGHEFHNREMVENDFALMSKSGINAVRTYTPPPVWLLDIAARHELWVMVGLPWEQHIAFLGSKKTANDIERRIREEVRKIAGHPAILCFVIGNEIPGPIVRWHGPNKVQKFLKQLFDATKAEDPGSLVTYVNYPTTEYLDVSFVDFYSFNVYLETPEKLESYLNRLQNMAGDRPLVMAEIGLDSKRNGAEKQAEVLDWQIQTAFRAGCAGTFIFSWTDEWYRGGFDIEDWDFGITDRKRNAKLALEAVEKAYSQAPFAPENDWPKVSVLVCSHNGERTIGECLENLSNLEYPNYEVIVVDDGSSDKTAEIAAQYDCRLIQTENRGLSSARNKALESAEGEIVAYIDDDAYPDSHWLHYISLTLLTSQFVGVGGPNIPPPRDGQVADCVANSPGGPNHVLLSDREAEHIPGCNMAYWKKALLDIGGFDPQFRSAGDDVDICWRLQEAGGKIGFHPAAVVWHHRRNSFRVYLKQQIGYGKAESLLEKKWPQKYNCGGHHSWSGKIYGRGLTGGLSWTRGKIYQGTWGSALFQSFYEPSPSFLQSMLLTPEWYIVTVVLAFISSLGIIWAPLLWALPISIFSCLLPITYVLKGAFGAEFTSNPVSKWEKWKLIAITAAMHLTQPVVRLFGRIRNGLTPWRKNNNHVNLLPTPREVAIWSEEWISPHSWLEQLEEIIKSKKIVVQRGGDFDSWDLEVRGGSVGSARIKMVAEEHGAGKQFVRFFCYPKISKLIIALTGLFGILFAWSAFDQQTLIGWTFGFLIALLVIGLWKDCLSALNGSFHAIDYLKDTMGK